MKNSGYTHLEAFTCSVRPERSGPVSSRRPTVARRPPQSKGGPQGSKTPSSGRTRESFIRIRGPHKASHICHENAVQVSASSRPRHPREGGDPRPRLLAKSRLVGQRTPFSSSYVAQGPWAIPMQGDLCITPSPLRGKVGMGVEGLQDKLALAVPQLWILASAGMTEVMQRSPQAGIHRPDHSAPHRHAPSHPHAWPSQGHGQFPRKETFA